MSNVIDTVNMGYFIYDDVDTRDYDVQVYFKSVDSTPKRVGSFVSIPSRNGAFFVDEGRYEDMPHSYDIIALDPEEGKNIINAIARKTGHHRLEDSFNQDEFYQAIFVSAVEVRTETDRQYLKYALTFTRKPQRFLKSGESATSKANNSTITNPTLFDAHPLISFNASGDGTITIGDKPLNFYNKPLGIIPLPFVVYNYRPTGNYYCLDLVTFDENTPHNTGDTFTFVGAKATLTIQSETEISSVYFVTGQALRYIPGGGGVSGNTATITLEDWQESSFVYGTARTVTKSVEWRIVVAGSSTYQTQTITLELIYGGANTIRVRWGVALTSGMTISSGSSSANYVANVDSTANSLTGDLYIDLDIGEAYRIENGSVVSINNFANLGGELPTLPPGNTTITYDNTISNFKITPRWWKI